MKKAFLALSAVALLFATSCKKESVNPAIDVPEGSFLATIDNGANPQNAPVVKDGMSTMTTIDGNRFVIWETGDEIKINGSIYTTDASGSSVIFSGGNATGTTFHAFFPATIAGTDAAGTLPATQTYVSGKVSNLPMYACSESNQLTFHNICAALKIVIPSFLNGATSIEVSSSDKAMNGAFTVTDDAAVMTATTPSAAEKKVTIAKASGTFAIGDTVYIAVPANTYSNLKVEAFNNTTSMWNKTLATCTLNVNKVYNVNITPMGVCFTALQNNSTVDFGNRSLFDYYDETDNTWHSWSSDHNSAFTLNQGAKLYLRAHTNQSELNSNSFSLTGSLKVSGNIMYLLDPTGASTTVSYNAFNQLFQNCTGLYDAGDLLLPATTLGDQCYKYMFSGCKNLVNAPQLLPATTMKSCCYEYMFSGCESLVIAPQLSATTLEEFCCSKMFFGCKSLVTAPQLPATTMKNSCYADMFSGCESLVTAPQLPATTMANLCYARMFHNCKSLVTAPQLPASSVGFDEIGCYNAMFYNCEALCSVTMLLTSEDMLGLFVDNWLYGAGTNAENPTIYVINNEMKTFFESSDDALKPSNWSVAVYSAPSQIRKK